MFWSVLLKWVISACFFGGVGGRVGGVVCDGEVVGGLRGWGRGRGGRRGLRIYQLGSHCCFLDKMRDLFCEISERGLVCLADTRRGRLG